MDIPEFLPRRIALVGYSGAGKTTAANHLATKYGFVRESFANPIKDAIENLFKELDFGPVSYDTIKTTYPEQTRTLAQILGNDIGRKIDEDYWVTWFDRQHYALLNDADVPVVIDDLRYINEAQWCRENGFSIIYLDTVSPPAPLHESESFIEAVGDTASVKFYHKNAFEQYYDNAARSYDEYLERRRQQESFGSTQTSGQEQEGQGES